MSKSWPSTSTRLTPESDASTAATVKLIGRGLTAHEIQQLLPNLGLSDMRAALLRAAEIVRDESASLPSHKPAAAIAAEARATSALGDEDAMALAVDETRAAGSERVRRGQ